MSRERECEREGCNPSSSRITMEFWLFRLSKVLNKSCFELLKQPKCLIQRNISIWLSALMFTVQGIPFKKHLTWQSECDGKS